MADLLNVQQSQQPIGTTLTTQSRPTREQIQAWFELPLMDLLLLAQNKLREHFPPNAVQVSTLKIAAIAHSQDTIALTYNLKRKSK